MIRLILLLNFWPLLLYATPGSLRTAASEVSSEELHRTVEKLVSFGTRHTLSSQIDPDRGIGAALLWTEEELLRYSLHSSNALTIVKTSDVVTGKRVPTPTRVTDLLAIQRGTTDSNRVIIISAHIDSRVTDVMNFTREAPGANDDASGVAAVLEAARILSKRHFPATIVYAILSGEEQGLLGGKILASYARSQGWEVMATLNNDIIGNSTGTDGRRDSRHVRVFSEGPRWQGDESLRTAQRTFGGENDSPSRNLSRYVAEISQTLSLGIEVKQIWRKDRFGRDGDHTEMLNVGFPAIRFTVGIENYDQQHQDLRVDNGHRFGDTIDVMDFKYLRRVTQLNVAALAKLSSAPGVPTSTATGALGTDTTVKWTPVAGAAGYVVHWRATDAANWQKKIRASVNSTNCVLKGVRVDDWIFGVASVSAEGFESPVGSAVPGGAFKPYTTPTK